MQFYVGLHLLRRGTGIWMSLFFCPFFYRYNGSLPNGDRGRRKSRFALFKRPKANGVKPSTVHIACTPQAAKVSLISQVTAPPGGCSAGPVAYQCKWTDWWHRIGGCLSCSGCTVVEFNLLKDIRQAKSKIRKFNFRKVKFYFFRELVNKTPWESVLKDQKVEQIWQIFKEAFTCAQELSITRCRKSEKEGHRPA